MNDILFISNLTEICSVKVTIGNESIFVIGIYRPPDKAKLPQFDEILSDVLTRFGAEDFAFLLCDFNLDIFVLIIMRLIVPIIY